MKYYRELYAEQGAWAVIDDNGTFKGWLPSDTTAAAKALADTSGTGIESQGEAEKIGTGERLPPLLSTDLAASVKSAYQSNAQE